MSARARLQVILPATTVEALDRAAERYGLSRAEMVQHFLSGSLAHLNILPLEKAEWPKMRPPAPLQRPIILPTRLTNWLETQPGNMSDAVRQAVKRGIEIEADGGKMGGPPIRWLATTRRVNVRWPAELVAVIQARADQHRMGFGKVATVYILATYTEATRRHPVPTAPRDR